MRKTFSSILLTFLVFSATAQKITLETYSANEEQRFYNLDGAELYLIAGVDTIFIPKEGRYKFLMPKVDTSINGFKLLVETCRYVYTVNLQKEDFNAKELGVGFYREKRKSYKLLVVCMGECMSLVSKMERIKKKR